MLNFAIILKGLCDGRLPSDSALGRFSPKFYKSCDLAQSMILRTIFRHLNWLEDIWWPKIVILFLELAPSIVGRPTPAPVPPILLVISRLLIESLFGARSSEARVIWTGGYGLKWKFHASLAIHCSCSLTAHVFRGPQWSQPIHVAWVLFLRIRRILKKAKAVSSPTKPSILRSKGGTSPRASFLLARLPCKAVFYRAQNWRCKEMELAS